MKKKNGNGFGKFLAGAAIGVGLGVLFAPKAGSETRKELKQKFDDLVKKIKELDMQEVKENFLKKIEEIKEELADLDKEKVITIARDRAEIIGKKIDELVKEAKEKATPVIEKAALDLKAKTVVVLKDTIKRLEEPKKDKKEKNASKKENTEKE